MMAEPLLLTEKLRAGGVVLPIVYEKAKFVGLAESDGSDTELAVVNVWSFDETFVPAASVDEQTKWYTLPGCNPVICSECVVTAVRLDID